MSLDLQPKAPGRIGVMVAQALARRVQTPRAPEQPPHLSRARKGESCQLFIHLFFLPKRIPAGSAPGSVCEGVHTLCSLDGFARLNLCFILALPLLHYTPVEATSGKQQPPCRSKRNEVVLAVGLCPAQSLAMVPVP